ncbi:SDR family oxidoreductase [Bordetella flabilis]|uniref:NAD(P)-binding domain-containing protein n=1 Tax=Bordetella flabilis TaxID=463014 RepID=A0A193GCG4_9BORD|nr:SDR family oxidoreductase [Bordetella flabilis]ANN76974.1 hypothetical protein BAU07_07490 [Bordetella flabilis]
MKILLTGATGFIGRRLVAALMAQGHTLRCVSRTPPSGVQASGALAWLRMDYAQALSATQWAEAVRDCDAVINAAGILRSHGSQTLERVHGQAPCALFEAARIAGVSRIVQISALGADAGAASAYHLSKKIADDALRALGIPYSIVQPSLVFGPEGASARFFMATASLPLIPLAGMDDSLIQPVLIDDLVQAVLALLAMPAHDMPPVVAAVGPRPLSLRAYYEALRATLHLPRRARFVRMPLPLVQVAARMGDVVPGTLLNTDTLAMLMRGNTADSGRLQRLLGRAPRPADAFVEPAYASALAAQARLAWLLPVLRWSIALVWIVTAFVSAFGYPVADSYELLRRAGVPDAALAPALYGAAGLDLLLGICVVLPRRRRWLWLAQAALVIGYTIIISLRLPEFWLHPYGPMVKNLPFLAMLWLLYELEDRKWTS